MPYLNHARTMKHPRFSDLTQWLAWQESLHPQTIDLSLERLQPLVAALKLQQPPYSVITVGGTNGKGSTVAFLEAMLRAAGYCVGAYTSPHILCYNERIRVDGENIDDDALCASFAYIDTLRGDTTLTYFEFGTLAALEIFRQRKVDVAVLEVGLGGRLDAVNAVDADAAVVTSIAIDHVQWLGSDRDSIGFEKAGIYRSGKPAICAEPAPPDSLLNYASAIGAQLYRVNHEYGFYRNTDSWTWWHGQNVVEQLPLPLLHGDYQFSNAAAALMALSSLSTALPVPRDAIHQGLTQAQLAGRFQIIPGPVEWILDVAHNVQSATVLANGLRNRPCAGVTHGIVGMLADKDASGVARTLRKAVQRWYAATLPGPRGQTGEQLTWALKNAGIEGVIPHFSSVAAACRAALAAATCGDRLVVFGSFHTLAEALASGLSGNEGGQPAATTGVTKHG